jgi:hypothetical protein
MILFFLEVSGQLFDLFFLYHDLRRPFDRLVLLLFFLQNYTTVHLGTGLGFWLQFDLPSSDLDGFGHLTTCFPVGNLHLILLLQ